jgi:uncharacterized membrane protein YGL010W
VGDIYAYFFLALDPTSGISMGPLLAHFFVYVSVRIFRR